MNDEVFYEIAIKNLTNESSEEERAQLKRYLLLPEYQAKYDELADVLKNHPAEAFQEFNLNRGLKKLRYKIKQAESDNFFSNRKIMAIAASLVVLLGLGILFNNDFFVPKPVNYVSVTSMAGQRTEILLPDSSIVYLNSGATIRYPEKFLSNQRDVELKGEAFFKVKRNVDKPFTVISGNFKTTVLGTSFSVSNNDENDFQVVVKTGKVKVENNITKKQFILIKNTQVAFNAEDGELEKSTVNSEYVTDWHKNLLRFDAITAKEAFSKIEKWYNVKIYCEADSILNRKIRAAYSDEPLEKVFKSLEFMIGLKYEIENDTIIIK
ncbi:FecR family protein [Tamlana crocina]